MGRALFRLWLVLALLLGYGAMRIFAQSPPSCSNPETDGTVCGQVLTPGPNNAQNTPATLQSKIYSLMGGLLNCSNDNVNFYRNFTKAPLFTGCDCTYLYVCYFVKDRSPLTEQNPCKLATGNYTWTITNDNQITFGQVTDVSEWRSRHLHLANFRGVKAAGEMWIPPNPMPTTIFWNLASGSFNMTKTKDLNYFNQQLSATTAVFQAFAASEPACLNAQRTFQYQYDSLFGNLPPTTNYIVDNYCPNYSDRFFSGPCGKSPTTWNICQNPNRCLNAAAHSLPSLRQTVALLILIAAYNF